MARENQGIQIALIVFVILTIILGATTIGIFTTQKDKVRIAEQAKDAALAKADAAKNLADECMRLKKLIGEPEGEDLAKIEGHYKEDMDQYAEPFRFPPEVRYYRPILKELARTILDKSGELKAAQELSQKLDTDFKAEKQTILAQVAKFDQAAKAATQDVGNERANFNKERQRMAADQSQVAGQLKKAREEGADALAKIKKNLEDTEGYLKKLAVQNQQQREKITVLEKEDAEIPSGEVRWADQKSGTVWINLGQADAVALQTTFSVYNPDATDMTKAGRKASIEVTQIRGDHLAEARVVEDKMSDPIMPGDKIYNPIWSPGQRKHFALAGFMDLDGDGRSDQQVVSRLIAMQGGVVDCEADEKGELKGEVTINTRYLVLGDPPEVAKDVEGAAKKAQIDVYSKIVGEARRVGVQKIPLTEFLQRAGWKGQTSVIRYGRGANPADFRAKPPEGASKPSAGTTDAFRPRKPPELGPRGAY